MQAAGVTVLLACLAMPLAMLVGLFVAVARLYGPRWLDWLLTVYVELLRGTPVLMQLFVIYYLLAEVCGHQRIQGRRAWISDQLLGI